jgi:hypothetical protein
MLVASDAGLYMGAVEDLRAQTTMGIAAKERGMIVAQPEQGWTRGRGDGLRGLCPAREGVTRVRLVLATFR